MFVKFKTCLKTVAWTKTDKLNLTEFQSSNQQFWEFEFDQKKQFWQFEVWKHFDGQQSSAEFNSHKSIFFSYPCALQLNDLSILKTEKLFWFCISSALVFAFASEVQSKKFIRH